jgi:hypothetical protein
MEWEIDQFGDFLIEVDPTAVEEDFEGKTKEEFIPELFEYMRGNSPYEYGSAKDLFLLSLSNDENTQYNRDELPVDVGFRITQTSLGSWSSTLYIYEADSDDMGVITKIHNVWVLQDNWFAELQYPGNTFAKVVPGVNYERPPDTFLEAVEILNETLRLEYEKKCAENYRQRYLDCVKLMDETKIGLNLIGLKTDRIGSNLLTLYEHKFALVPDGEYETGVELYYLLPGAYYVLNDNSALKKLINVAILLRGNSVGGIFRRIGSERPPNWEFEVETKREMLSFLRQHLKKLSQLQEFWHGASNFLLIYDRAAKAKEIAKKMEKGPIKVGATLRGDHPWTVATSYSLTPVLEWDQDSDKQPDLIKTKVTCHLENQNGFRYCLPGVSDYDGSSIEGHFYLSDERIEEENDDTEVDSNIQKGS